MQIVLVILYGAFVVSMWRIASYLCVKHKWLLLVPIVNAGYFSHVCDVLAVEVKEYKRSYFSIVTACSIVVLILCTVFLQTDVYIIACRIGLLLSAVVLFLTLSQAYMTILLTGMKYPILTALASFVIPFPVFLLIASFTIKQEVEEVISLYY